MNLEDEFDDDKQDVYGENKVTIVVEKRGGKRFITNVVGLATDLDLHKILSYLKKKHNCSGSVIENEEYGDIMTFTGDQKENVYNFLIKEKICDKENIIIKGV